MKALLIDSGTELREVRVDDIGDVRDLIGFNTIAFMAIGVHGDRLYFDEWCYLHESSGRFRVDDSIPLAGKAVIVGVVRESGALCDVCVDIDDLSGRIDYL